MATELEIELRRLSLGDHACALYDSHADDCATIVPFVIEGLRRRECCNLVSPADEAHAFSEMLSDAGIDVEQETDRGALDFIDPAAVVGNDLDGMTLILDDRERRAVNAVEAGFAGLRTCGRMPRALCTERQLLELHALTNELVARRRLLVLCRYDLRETSAWMIRQVLRVHPIAIIGPLVCPSPYYEPPNMALGRCSDEECVQWMIGQLWRSRSARLTAEQAMQARDHFLSAASHELQTPLALVQLVLQSIMRCAETSRDEQLPARAVLSKLAQAQDSLLRLAAIVRRLVEAAQLCDDRLKLSLDSVDLIAVVREAIASLEPRARRAGCSIDLVEPREPIVGAWDRLRLGQVASNLVSNAIDFGEGHPIEVTIARVGPEAHLVVRDHGAGIRPEDVRRIFERFERATTNNHSGGFGLGLWLAKKIVDSFHGSIVAGNAPGGGAVFTVELPIEASG